MNYTYRVMEIPGGIMEAVAFLNARNPSLDVVLIDKGWRVVTIVFREPKIPDFYPNGPGYPNGVVY